MLTVPLDTDAITTQDADTLAAAEHLLRQHGAHVTADRLMYDTEVLIGPEAWTAALERYAAGTTAERADLDATN